MLCFPPPPRISVSGLAVLVATVWEERPTTPVDARLTGTAAAVVAGGEDGSAALVGPGADIDARPDGCDAPAVLLFVLMRSSIYAKLVKSISS